ncbi:hypothetical protein ACFSJY_07800 [Thalassotalea euphylliae]|uniref:hypothetical protein n=1 Tax=Thalassotalea euphylliae TaxID=1655234 RepID=UPI003632879B
MKAGELAITAQYHQACSVLVFERDRQRDFFAIDAKHSLAIADIYQRIQEKHPNAGRGYWSVNLWRQLVWQPIYLAITSVCYQLPLPNLRTVKQCVDDAVIYKVCEGGSYLASNQPLDLHEVCQHLIDSLTEMLSMLQSVCRLQRHKANAQVQDLLAVGLKRIYAEQGAEVLQPMLRAWQQALKMPALNHFTDHETPQLVRADCCMHIKITPEAPCANCPKLNRKGKKHEINTT